MRILCLFVLLGLFGFTPRDSFAYEPLAATRAVEIVRAEWRDTARGREVPVKIYFPRDGSSPLPIIIFSHGLGGSREGYEYLGRHWAGCGYVSVHLEHEGSDESVWKDLARSERLPALKKAALVPGNIANRPRDVSFAIDRLTALNADETSPLKDRLDLQRIGVAGHSFGGFTALAVAGQNYGPLVKWSDPRVKGAIQMSAPVARPALRTTAYDSITIPVFHMTGTRDDSPIGDTTAAERRIPFDQMNSAETCLLTFADGDHMVFAGAPRLREEARAQDEEFHKLICTGSTAFWEVWLRGDAAARTWLMDGGFARQVGALGVFEKKSPSK